MRWPFIFREHPDAPDLVSPGKAKDVERIHAAMRLRKGCLDIVPQDPFRKVRVENGKEAVCAVIGSRPDGHRQAYGVGRIDIPVINEGCASAMPVETPYGAIVNPDPERHPRIPS